MASCGLHPRQRDTGSRCRRPDCEACAAAGPAASGAAGLRPSDPGVRTSTSQLQREVREEFANDEAARRAFVERAAVEILCAGDAHEDDACYLAAKTAAKLWDEIRLALRGES